MGDPSFDKTYQQFGDVGSLKSWLYDWKGLNQWIFEQANAYHSGWYDKLMTAISQLGVAKNMPYFMVFALLCMAIGFGVRKVKGHAGNKQYLIQWCIAFIVVVAGFFVVEQGAVHALKDYFSYPRPYAVLDHVTQVEQRPAEDSHHTFPSGHAAMITLLVIGFWPVMSSAFRTLGCWLILAVAWSRWALGVHFPVDTLAGFLVALICMKIVAAFIHWLVRKLFRINC